MNDKIDYTHPETGAAAPDALQALSALFDRQIADGMHPAAQMVVLHRGKALFDRVGGMARGRPVTPETPFYTFSATKAFTGICVHKLIDAGKVELDAPVAVYWPEFGKKGKAEITVRQVFLHLAGIPVRGFYRQVPLWPFWGALMRSIANLEPEFPPGSKMAYHLVNYGFILGEIVRRVSGLPIEVFFEREFARPLGMHRSWLKIPARELRLSPRIYAMCADQKGVARVFNSPPLRKAVNPAASLHSTAREMAVFYHMLVNGGEYAGRRFLKPETIQQATTLGYQGWDHLVQREAVLAYGFHLGGHQPPPGQAGPIYGARSTTRTFGHVGNRSCMAWADHDSQLVVTFVCNGLASYNDTRARWTDLSNAAWALIGD